MSVDTSGFGPRLETERLILRPPVEADFAPLSAAMQDEENTRYIGGVQSPPMAWRALMSVIGHWAVRGYGFFTVLDKETGRWAGRVGPWYPHGWSQPEVGWTIARSHWGKGYASEAAAASLDWAFDHLGWDSVIHLIDEKNTGSIGVAKRLGSYKTGRTEEVAGFGMIVDVWGQTREEWRSRR
ncbi:MAG: GNAT family N-acetyltransferase [Maricaulis sp.]|jgi:RimJ/RimL family protein N-acetyltransferase|nr:GNAT family N-acetyltransferase [Maricaulis sp.]MAL11423.1 GNAT family N-acetyltransferase [Maricaulis sp.]HAQ34886.1 N-acetyltransferase [Alphaproteobacteria bacterium]